MIKSFPVEEFRCLTEQRIPWPAECKYAAQDFNEPTEYYCYLDKTACCLPWWRCFVFKEKNNA